MVDSETNSLWSHLLGEAKQGELEGQVLESVPSHMTDWKTWREAHPETSVLMLERTYRAYRREFYKHLEQFLVGMSAGELARAWKFDDLQLHPVVNDQFNDSPVVVVFDRASRTALIFDRTVDGQVLTFEQRDDHMIDEQSGTTWEPTTGRAISGERKGASLTQAIGVISYSHTWATFYPASEYWMPE